MSRMPAAALVPHYEGTAPQAIEQAVRNSLSSHILPTAATMVGVCMTVLSIGRLSHAGRLGVFVARCWPSTA